VEPHVISHLALHMEQSMEAAANIVAEIDRLAMASHRKVTRALAAEALARQGHAGLMAALERAWRCKLRHQTFILVLQYVAAMCQVVALRPLLTDPIARPEGSS
jgi:hypothetical protein